jgi:hypothetical protein
MHLNKYIHILLYALSKVIMVDMNIICLVRKITILTNNVKQKYFYLLVFFLTYSANSCNKTSITSESGMFAYGSSWKVKHVKAGNKFLYVYINYVLILAMFLYNSTSSPLTNHVCFSLENLGCYLLNIHKIIKFTQFPYSAYYIFYDINKMIRLNYLI